MKNIKKSDFTLGETIRLIKLAEDGDDVTAINELKEYAGLFQDELNEKGDIKKFGRPLSEIVNEYNLALEYVHEHINKIPNNYKGKTPEQVWNGWTKLQREHFLLDHNHFVKPHILEEHTISQLADKSYADIIRIGYGVALVNHIEEGQYEHGGKIPNNYYYLKIGNTIRDTKNNVYEFLGYENDGIKMKRISDFSPDNGIPFNLDFNELVNKLNDKKAIITHEIINELSGIMTFITEDLVYETDRDKVLLQMEIDNIKSSFKEGELKSEAEKLITESGQIRKEANVLLEKLESKTKGFDDTMAGVEAVIRYKEIFEVEDAYGKRHFVQLTEKPLKGDTVKTDSGQMVIVKKIIAAKGANAELGIKIRDTIKEELRNKWGDDGFENFTQYGHYVLVDHNLFLIYNQPKTTMGEAVSFTNQFSHTSAKKLFETSNFGFTSANELYDYFVNESNRIIKEGLNALLNESQIYSVYLVNQNSIEDRWTEGDSLAAKGAKVDGKKEGKMVPKTKTEKQLAKDLEKYAKKHPKEVGVPTTSHYEDKPKAIIEINKFNSYLNDKLSEINTAFSNKEITEVEFDKKITVLKHEAITKYHELNMNDGKSEVKSEQLAKKQWQEFFNKKYAKHGAKVGGKKYIVFYSSKETGGMREKIFETESEAQTFSKEVNGSVAPIKATKGSKSASKGTKVKMLSEKQVKKFFESKPAPPKSDLSKPLFKKPISEIIKKVGKKGKYWHLRIHTPKDAVTCRLPDWAVTIAKSVHEGSKVTTCKDKAGEWHIQNVIVPAVGPNKVGKAEAQQIAVKIYDKINKK